jgi:hypothetical protein
MSEDERSGDEYGQDELIAAFAALGGRLTGDEFIRLLGSAEYYGRVVRLAGLLLAGDTAAADDVARARWHHVRSRHRRKENPSPIRGKRVRLTARTRPRPARATRTAGLAAILAGMDVTGLGWCGTRTEPDEQLTQFYEHDLTETCTNWSPAEA